MMGPARSFVALGDIMKPAIDPHRVDPETAYPNIGIYSFGRGIFRKPPIVGSTSSASTLYRVRAGQFIYSRLFAFEGAYGIVPPEADGAFVSNEFPAFDIDQHRADPGYLGWLFRVPAVWRALAEKSVGMGDRRKRVKPENVLAHRIALPPIQEQRRLANRVERVATLVEQQKEMHRAILVELDAMLANSFARIIADAPRLKMSEVAPLHRRPVQVEPEGEYPELAVRSFGRGVFHKGTLIGAELTWQSLFRAEKGDLLFSNIKAWEGAFAVVGESDHGRVGSHRYLTCVPVPNVAESWFLWFYLQTPEGLLQTQEASPGSADRNRTLSTKRLMAIKVPVPPIEKQRAFVRLLGRANEARQALASARSDRDQLLPVLLRRMFADAAKALAGTERSAA